MQNKRIIIAGGTGFIGEEMIKYFGKTNDLIILTRQISDARNNRNQYQSLAAENLQRIKYVKWDAKAMDTWQQELEGADLLINLAGKTVNCRYTAKNKKEILESRIDAVNILGEAIRHCQQPPRLWINASSATVYRHAMDTPQDEYSGEIQNDFSVQVCKACEKAFYEQQTPQTRKVALRMAITLGPGGVLIPYFNLLKFGLGGKQGSGNQQYSWVHIDDTCRMIEWISAHPELNGTYNCCSPNPVSNKVFMQLLRKATNHKFGLPAYTWMLKMGAAFIGTETELVLKSRWVIPSRILETGFQFRYPLLEDALEDIISKVPRKQYHLF
jgi:uncharacterized protein (TIGR01777 family)